MDHISNIQWNKVAPCLVLLILDVVLEFSECTTQAEVNKHLQLGMDFLVRGQLSDALTHYHAAVEGDPKNYLTYFKRGTVYYALGKAKFALQDFSKVLELKPDFTSARMHRAEVYFKLAEYSKAKDEFLQVTYEDPYNEEAAAYYNQCDTWISEAQLAQAYHRGQDYRAAADTLSRLLDVSPWAATLRQLRADCYIALNNFFSAVSDIRSVNRMQQDNTDGHYQLVTLLYQLGHVSDALKEVRECLKLDPEHKQCFPLYKKLKKVDKLLLQCETLSEGGQFSRCVESGNQVLAVEEEVTLVVFEAKRWICSCAVKDEQFSEAISVCSAALQLRQDARLLADLGDAYIGLEMLDDAIRSFKESLEVDEGYQRAKDGMARAQRLQKQLEQRDYYKILGVKRSASKQEIIKAYRKAAQKWHPDAYHGDEKKIAEKRFIDVAAAKEVLTDPEKRAQFDSGVDPLDPESGRQNFQQNPFHHFQHGSPFQFKFHFN